MNKLSIHEVKRRGIKTRLLPYAARFLAIMHASAEFCLDYLCFLRVGKVAAIMYYGVCDMCT
jgi:hypothetical protein